MKTTLQQAYELLENFSIIPLKESKAANLWTWGEYQKEKITEEKLKANFLGYIGIVAGFEDLEVVDVDTKVLATDEEKESFWEDLLGKLRKEVEDFDKKVAIYETISGGYHILYKAKNIEGSKKLSKLEGHKEHVTETKGVGGYVVAYPNRKKGELSYSEIGYITDEERNKIIAISKSYNFEEEAPPEPTRTHKKPFVNVDGGLTTIEHYNEATDVWTLISEDFKKVKGGGKNQNILRIGSKADKSGTIYNDSGFLWLWTPNTIYPQERLLSPFEVYTIKHHHHNKSKAAQELYRLGYGTRQSNNNSFTPPQQTSNFMKEEPAVVIDIPNTMEGEELLIVETPTEATTARSEGVVNVVALEGKKLTRGAIKQAISKGIKNFTLHLPEEKLQASIKELAEEEVGAIFVAKEPTSKGFNEATVHYKHTLEAIINKYLQLGDLTDKQALSFEDELQDIGEVIVEKKESDKYEALLLEIVKKYNLGITEETLKQAQVRLQERRKDRKTKEKIKNLLEEAAGLNAKGDNKKTFDKIEEAKAIRLETIAVDDILEPTTEEALRERIKSKPAGIDTGLTIGGKALLLPTGAITTIAAPTKHGKTTFMLNLANNIAQQYEEKKTFFFSYEEASDEILLKLLRTYIGKELNLDSNLNAIRNSIRNGQPTDITPIYEDEYIEKKNAFFNDLIETNRLNEVYTNQNVEDLADTIRRLANDHEIAAIFIDYIQLLGLPIGKYRTYSRQQEIKVITDILKDVSVDTGIAIVIGAQFNGDAKNHYTLEAANLREAADIAHSTHLLLGFWNNNYDIIFGSLKGNLEEELRSSGKMERNTLYTKVLLNRSGEAGTTEVLHWNGAIGKISNNRIETLLDMDEGVRSYNSFLKR